MGIVLSLRAVTTLSKQQWLVKGEPQYGECWLLQTVFFAEIDFLEKHLTPEKAFRDATIIQDGRGLYILLVN